MPLPHAKRRVSFLGTFGLFFIVIGLYKTIDLGIYYYRVSELDRNHVITNGLQPQVLLSLTTPWLVGFLILTVAGVAMMGFAVKMDRKNKKAAEETSTGSAEPAAADCRVNLSRKIVGPSLVILAAVCLFLARNASRHAAIAELAVLANEILSLSSEGRTPEKAASIERDREVAEHDRKYFRTFAYSMLTAGILLSLCGAIVCYSAWKPA